MLIKVLKTCLCFIICLELEFLGFFITNFVCYKIVLIQKNFIQCSLQLIGSRPLSNQGATGSGN